ncbi:MAG: ATP-binding protein [Candidatus Eremiobacterota bacterium]
MEYRIKAKSGEWKWIRGRGKVVERDKDGNSVRMVGTNTDITGQKEWERKLRLSEEKFFKAFNTSPDSMSITRLSDGRFLEINRGFIKLHGYTQDEVTNKTSLELNIWSKPSERRKLINILKTSGEVTGMEINFLRKDGSSFTGLMSANILHLNDEECIFSVVRDITERKKLEAQLLQAQKMEAIGQLAGGIAHDFNNILTGILGYANMLKLEARDDELVYEAAVTIEKAGERAAELTKQLLGFSRKAKRRNSRVDLNDVAREVINLLSRTIEENITIISKLDTFKAIVLGDSGQLQQAIINLVVNARDAMPDGGKLILETEKICFDEKYCLNHVGLTPGEYVRFSVVDTGTGIAKDIQEHIFEPFFTTKEQGKGTGMGLAMVYGIVKNHGGTIRVSSEVNKGTSFHIYLPLNSRRTVEKKRKDNLIRGRGTIMLVDDEKVILDITSRALKGLGYEVVPARDGREALSYYEKSGNTIDLIIMDLVMPEMGAEECIKALRKFNSSIPIVLSTGYAPAGKVREIIDGGCRFIQKPYSIQELSEVIAMAMKGEANCV